MTALLILDIVSFFVGLAVIGFTVYRRPGKNNCGLFAFGIMLSLWALLSLGKHAGLGIPPSTYLALTTIFFLALPTAILIASMQFANANYTTLCLIIFAFFFVFEWFYHENFRPHLLEKVYSLVFLGLTAYFLRKPFARSDYQYRRRSNIIFAGILLIWFMIWNYIVFSYFDNPAFIDPTTGLYLYACAGVLVWAKLVDLPSLELAYSREQVLESMSDGWMLLDKNDKVVDFNPAARNLFAIQEKEILGQRLHDVLLEQHGIVVSTLESDINFRLDSCDSKQTRFVNLRVVQIEENIQIANKIVFWRDITEFQKAELARQQARDEMSMLLHAISRAAIEHSSQKEFLNQVILQIAYSFHCQSGIFWMYEYSEKNNLEITPITWTGISTENVALLYEATKQTEIQEMFTALEEHHYIENTASNPTLNLPLDKLEQGSLLIEPFSSGNHRIGMLWLMRETGASYSLEELTRLALVMNEVATLNYFNQQNQSAIVAAERQRLMRDLHDSVTQRLYGLVALTEAAQAGLATGSGVIQPQIIIRISEHARQAIKEMRLFLHQLQTVNFDKENLVMLLHRRLAAVEGRSDVRTQFDADLTLTFSVEKQKALYYIAQEALNNTLRHASAKNVALKLKKTSHGAILSISDDGKGFDQRNWDTGGLGIKNMKARAKDINARLYIKSAPEQGTQVKVWIPLNSDLSVLGRNSK